MKLSMKEDNAIRCIHCVIQIEGKPWISVSCGKTKSFMPVITSFKSSKFLYRSRLWDRVLNKLKIYRPRPVFQTRNYRRDITVNFGIEEIRRQN